MSARQLLSTGSEWSFELIERYDAEIGRIAADNGLDTFPNQLEIISAEQMMDAYSSVGMPVNYHHWSFGKKYLSVENQYKRGHMGLAYEIVINSNPCIAYLMEENTMTMQALVIAHAAYGHNSFFKGNYLFQAWTSPDAIIDYLIFARDYIAKCERQHGAREVEALLDSCHTLMNYAVDSYKRPPALSASREAERMRERAESEQRSYDELWRTLPSAEEHPDTDASPRFPAEPQENLLYFIEKHAPLLEPWQREVVRIVRKVAQYFYPQRHTQVMNEGWACFWHYRLLNQLYDEGLVNDGFMLEFLQSHTNVLAQPDYDDRRFNGINPYALGFAMYNDIKRVCEAPTDEDRAWFGELAGSDWRPALDFAMRNFKDESFINQYLSPQLMRELHLFAVVDDDREEMLKVSAIHDEQGYRELRRSLASQYDVSRNLPNLQVYAYDRRGDRSLRMRHFRQHRVPLDDASTREVMAHIGRLWGFDVHLEVVDEEGHVEQGFEVRRADVLAAAETVTQ